MTTTKTAIALAFVALIALAAFLFRADRNTATTPSPGKSTAVVSERPERLPVQQVAAIADESDDPVIDAMADDIRATFHDDPDAVSIVTKITHPLHAYLGTCAPNAKPGTYMVAVFYKLDDRGHGKLSSISTNPRATIPQQLPPPDDVMACVKEFFAKGSEVDFTADIGRQETAVGEYIDIPIATNTSYQLVERYRPRLHNDTAWRALPVQ